MATSPRAFVLRHTRLRAVPGLEDIRLHLADEVLPLWHAVQVETGDPDAALPYWAFAWAGGLALGQYLGEHPDAVAGRRVLDLASGSGLCAIASMRAGAAGATAVDIDPLAVAVIELNARANGLRVTAIRRDVLDEEPPDVEVILAGDCWYEAGLAERVLPWLRRARDRGIEILVGDPGRRYLPADELLALASYEVRTTTELEDLDRKQGRVYTLREAGIAPAVGRPAACEGGADSVIL
ncbi:MAG: class I SAM-dependent methyltransferase [Candidatus Limnocylindrales bacterium]